MKGDGEYKADDGRSEDMMSSDDSPHSSQHGLDEEDYELIRENKFHRDDKEAEREISKSLRSKRVIEDSDEEDRTEETPKTRPREDRHLESSSPKRARSLETLFSEEEEEESEGLEDFIEEEEEEKTDERDRERTAKAKQPPRSEPKFLWGAKRNISKEAWNDLMDIFGDGSEYAALVWDQKEAESEDEEHVDSHFDDRKANSDEHARNEFEGHLATFPQHALYFAEEALWMQRELRRQYGVDADARTIEVVLDMLIGQRFPVPFIAAFRKDQCRSLKIFHLWSIHDWNALWVMAKRQAMTVSCKSINNADIVSDWVRRLPAMSNAETGGLSAECFAANVKSWAPLYSPQEISEGVDPQAILHRLLLSEAIDPILRKIESIVVINTSPTDVGKRLGTRHETAAALSLHHKPLHSFSKESLAIFSHAVHSKYCTCELLVPKEQRDVLYDQLRQLYSIDAVGDSVMSALLDGLVEHYVRKLSFTAHRESMQWIAQCCGAELLRRLSGGPCRNDQRIGIVSCGSGEPGAVLGAVIMNGRELQDYQRFHKLFDNDSSAEWSLLVDYVKGCSVVLVSGYAHTTVPLYQRLKKENVAVQFAQDDVARQQPRALVDLYPSIVGCHPIIRYCVAVGLRFVSPCDAFGIFNDSELFKLDLHPLQSYVEDNELRLLHLKRALATVINQQGIAVDQSWLHRYVCGQVSGNGCKSREQLSAVASGFVLFPKSSNSLDHLRICKDDYLLVEKMLRDCFSEDSSLSMESMVETVRSQPQRLLSLDLSDFANHIGGGRLLMLEEYRRCLLSVDQTRANKPSQMSNEEIFWMVSGEREDRLQPGQRARVRLPPAPSAPSSVVAFLEGSNLPVRCMLDVGDGQQRRIGTTNAVVLCVNLKDFSPDSSNIGNVVRVSVHRDDLADPKVPFAADQYYRRVVEDKETATKNDESKSTGKNLLNSLPPALLHHAAFKGMWNKVETEQYLTNSVSGEAVIRIHDNRLMVSWRVCSQCPKIIAHTVLSHDGRHYTLPPSTKRYEDVDEVIARGIEPNARLFDDIVACPKHIRISSDNLGDKELSAQVERTLQEQASKQPGRIAYGLWLSRDSPGTAFLSIAPRHHETVLVEEGEYVFRRHRFRNISQLVDFLKRN